jgi:tetratricopeptide (TPR) repeat protein
MNRVVTFALVVGLAASALPARAAEPKGDRAAAAALLDRGNQLMRERAYEAALDHYVRAHQAYSSAKILLNVAEALLALGREEEAARRFEQFLADAPAEGVAAQRKLATERLAELDARLGRIDLAGSDAGLEIAVDGERRGVTPLAPVRVDPGRRAVVARAKDGVELRQDVLVRRGRTETLVLARPRELVPAPPAAASIPAPALVPDAGSVSAAAASPAGLSADTLEVLSSPWLWIAVGVLAAGGTSLALVAAGGGSDRLPVGELGVTNTADWQRGLGGR